MLPFHLKNLQNTQVCTLWALVTPLLQFKTFYSHFNHKRSHLSAKQPNFDPKKMVSLALIINFHTLLLACPQASHYFNKQEDKCQRYHKNFQHANDQSKEWCTKVKWAHPSYYPTNVLNNEQFLQSSEYPKKQKKNPLNGKI